MKIEKKDIAPGCIFVTERKTILIAMRYGVIDGKSYWYCATLIPRADGPQPPHRIHGAGERSCTPVSCDALLEMEFCGLIPTADDLLAGDVDFCPKEYEETDQQEDY